MLFNFKVLGVQERYQLLLATCLTRPIAWETTATSRPGERSFLLIHRLCGGTTDCAIGVGSHGTGAQAGGPQPHFPKDANESPEAGPTAVSS
jgi:hypothetical protein